MSGIRVWVAVAAALSIGVLAAGPAAADPPAPPGTGTATPFDGTPTVGALFRNGLAADHGCSASVVASPGHDLVLTAAHCVHGTAAGWQFVPGYDEGRTPYGVWTVTHAYVDPAWTSGQDPRHDYAILTVADQRLGGRTVGVQDVTGANVLGQAPRSGSTITDVAYNAGLDDQPIRCVTGVYYTDGYPSFNCHGYVGGSSGSPWITGGPGHLTFVVGVIAGLHQGGCYEYTSYSPAFRPDVYQLIARATLGLPADTVPAAGGDGC
ncbi:trypsin-like serine peptidase [Streptantibioticus silvisoli]|uniref:Trypsin-like serine protease n=1 Tax=Streptantibioticus silvisoli TaxID=2705255 RepID=A0ABT6VU71_9ACTN|nr:trypsin-like serine protease [Streptantibioticus silvisoli]MDI5962024.1 trypsin-like serine protease [Streptantibioticus silvisoli]